jgi:glycolate dehydrogenase iron-sulfur subunit
MQTQLADFISNTAEGREADAILRSCVHCGFCTATCPTYQLLGDEDDGPRGRIYLIKSVLEGNEATSLTQLHLDRCLTCRACETTCPSGVNYHRLLDIGRDVVDRQVPRSMLQRGLRWLLLAIMPQRRLFSVLMKTGQWFRPLLPAVLKEKIPPRTTARLSPPGMQHSRKMLLLEGCVQPAMAPNINIATARVLDALGISLEPAPGAGCCGALRHHLNAQQAARNDMRRNIDAWWPALQAGAEAVVINTSGCAPQVKDYATLLADDPEYAAKAEAVSRSSFDIAQILLREKEPLLAKLGGLKAPLAGRKVAFQSPCTLQHGQGIIGAVEQLLIAAGCELVPVADGHLCCGSAGTYSIFQPTLSQQLRSNKVSALTAGQPEMIATANIGCLSHLQPAVDIPVRHWIEIIDEALTGPG